MPEDLPTWSYPIFSDILRQAQDSLTSVGVVIQAAVIDVQDDALIIKADLLSDGSDTDPDGPMYMQYQPDLQAFHEAWTQDAKAACRSELIHLVLTLSTNALAAYQAVKGPLQVAELST